MKTATNLSADGRRHPITADLNAPQTATCPECDGAVVLRKRQFLWNCVQLSVAPRSWLFQIARKRMDGEITYFYRHKRGQGENCPRRYRPVR